MLEQEKKLLADAMTIARISKLPPKADPDDYTWIEAIAKIKLIDSSYAYGIVKRNPDLTYTVTYKNGATLSILCVEEVYPYEKLDKSMVKKFTNKDDAEGRVKYLMSLNLPYQIDFNNATVADLNKEIVKAALYKQVNNL